MNCIKLSIITPYYNTLKYIKELKNILEPQLTDEVEWIIIDDESKEKELDKMNAKIIHLEKNSGNAAYPRNVGLDNAQGDYIAFIDSDDLISVNYINSIIKKINKEEFDYCYISWRTKNHIIMIKEEPPEWNKSIWNCIYNRKIIKDIRFDTDYNINEDGEFNKKVRKGKRTNIYKVLYYYRWDEREDSLSNLHRLGKITVKRRKKLKCTP